MILLVLSVLLVLLVLSVLFVSLKKVLGGLKNSIALFGREEK